MGVLAFLSARCCGRSPTRGARIETPGLCGPDWGGRVAPPRGERGLKHVDLSEEEERLVSLPHAGSAD